MTVRGEFTIVGAGVIGLACALNLRRLGADVILLDEGADTPAASWGNAGHIAIEQGEPIASPRALASAHRRLFLRGGALDFRLGAIAAWGPWALQYVAACSPARFAHGKAALARPLAQALPAWRRLLASIDRPDLLREDGHLVVWETVASTAQGLDAWRAAETGAARFAPLRRRDCAALAPAVSAPLAGGVRFRNTGQIADLPALRDALRAALIAEGGQVRQARIAGMSLDRPQGRVSLSLAGGGSLQPDRVVIAAGVGSGLLMRGLGHAAPLIAERGYHIEGAVDDLAWGALPPVVFEDRSMIVTRFGERLRAASFVEFARRKTRPDPRKWARLERHVRELGLPMGGTLSRWMGARPTLPDYLPAIGVSPRASGVSYAFGHQHLGLTLAATTGEALAAVATGGATPYDLTAFSIDRFTRPSARGRASPQESPA